MSFGWSFLLFIFAIALFLLLIKLLGDKYLPMTEKELEEEKKDARIW